ncbi:TPA: hypothetical protein G8W20_004854 [Salmonella enterica]|uniref:Uncharacterized protein n=1 Tax=Salmonella enterica TaxID=28901 RepID=A0A758G6S2_SALER|nr:hypothetical protein [Salmonella enterica]
MSKLEKINNKIERLEQQLKQLKKESKTEEEAISLIIGDAMFKALNAGDPYMTKLILEESPKFISTYKGEKKKAVERVYQIVLHNCVSSEDERIKL